ncbi:hypothetical protein LTR84_000968 [Exophiala bonariae]|uniref:Putative zinc-finger domain-containing protein n=1 Tax=Exophiala bonariae TaxID=1690606 RepID=A0AAV9NUT5_9EURO|nr:hypothetical protein LTR84_000968 [Exophiala bonariae]
MAHPYSTTPAYSATGTPSYPVQQSFYPPYQSNPFQQPIQTPPGLPQPPHLPNHSVAPYPPTANNTARFDANSQVRPPAPPFPFPPEIFKQFASAGLPPPPPPVLLPNAGYPQFPVPLSVPVSSPYPQHGASGQNGYVSGFYATEQAPPNPQDPFITSQQGSRGTGDYRSTMNSETQSHSAPRVSHGGSQSSSPATNRGVDRGNREQNEALPSFGSRSDIDQLFATVQKQVSLPPSDEDRGSRLHAQQPSSIDGNASRKPQCAMPQPILTSWPAYDPTRPAVISSAISGGFGSSKTKEPVSFERKYDTSSLAELRQAAKGALLSLFSQKILYADVINEGIDSSILQHLYGELGIDYNQTADKDVVPHGHARVAAPSAVILPLQSTEHHPSLTITQKISPEPATLPRVEDTSASAALSAIKDLAKPNTAPSPSLERKDRIAQLLAAKAGRISAPSAVTPVPSSGEQSSAQPTTKLRDANLDGTAFSRPEPTEIQSNPVPAQQQHERVSQHFAGTPRDMKSKSDILLRSMPQSSKAALQVSQIPANQTSPDNRQAALTSLIPGLFMTTVESAADDVLMSGSTDNDSGALLEKAFPISPLPLKRHFHADSDTLPEAKRSNLSWDHQQNELPAQVNVPEDASEGEIIEDEEEQSTNMPRPGNDDGSNGHEFAEMDSYDRQAADQLQGFSASEPAARSSSGTQRAEIETRRQRILEMEEREEVKPSSSQEYSFSVPYTSAPHASRHGSIHSSSPAHPSSGRSETNTPSNLPRKPFVLGKAVKLTPAQLAERTAALKAELLKQRAQRQQVLQVELPSLNTEVQILETRLEKARGDLFRAQEEVAKCQDELSRARDTEAELRQEVQHLERQVLNGHSGQEQFSAELHQIQREKFEEGELRSQNAGENHQQHMQTSIGTGTVEEPNENLARTSPPQDATLPSHGISQEDVAIGENSGRSPHLSSAAVEAGYDDVNDDVPQTDEMEISPEPEPTSTPIITMFPTGDQTILNKQLSQEPPLDDDQGSDGSASMSDSGSDRDEDDYEPADADISQPMQQSDEDSDEYDPEEAPVSDFTPATGADDEAIDDYYEPAESIGALDTALSGTPAYDTDLVDNGSRHLTPVLSNPPLSEVLDDIPDISIDSMDRRPDLNKQNHQVPEVENMENQDEQNSAEATSNFILDGRSPSNPLFVPYKTPLSSFKTFRFHQAFDDTVKSGYRSLTYSNNIDPSQPLCSTELSGSLCTDPSCEEQHFRQLGLTDDKILVQMSSASDIKDKTIRDQYLVGLKQVIADLRQKEVKQFENVAQALSAYRRQFFAEKEEVS